MIVLLFLSPNLSYSAVDSQCGDGINMERVDALVKKAELTLETVQCSNSLDPKDCAHLLPALGIVGVAVGKARASLKVHAENARTMSAGDMELKKKLVEELKKENQLIERRQKTALRQKENLKWILKNLEGLRNIHLRKNPEAYAKLPKSTRDAVEKVARRLASPNSGKYRQAASFFRFGKLNFEAGMVDIIEETSSKSNEIKSRKKRSRTRLRDTYYDRRQVRSANAISATKKELTKYLDQLRNMIKHEKPIGSTARINRLADQWLYQKKTGRFKLHLFFQENEVRANIALKMDKTEKAFRKGIRRAGEKVIFPILSTSGSALFKILESRAFLGITMAAVSFKTACSEVTEQYFSHNSSCKPNADSLEPLLKFSKLDYEDQADLLCDSRVRDYINLTFDRYASAPEIKNLKCEPKKSTNLREISFEIKFNSKSPLEYYQLQVDENSNKARRLEQPNSKKIEFTNNGRINKVCIYPKNNSGLKPILDRNHCKPVSSSDQANNYLAGENLLKQQKINLVTAELSACCKESDWETACSRNFTVKPKGSHESKNQPQLQ
ncbi:MAG: hypothetical protein AB8E15_00890 [Bdellovibrionales bacterium]